MTTAIQIPSTIPRPVTVVLHLPDKVNAEVVRQQRLTWLNENILTYQTNFKSKHFLNALLGVTLQNSDYEYYSLRMKQIPNESLGMAGMSQGTFDKEYFHVVFLVLCCLIWDV